MSTNRRQLDALIKELDALGYDVDDDEFELRPVAGQGGQDYIDVTVKNEDVRDFYVHWDGTVSH